MKNLLYLSLLLLPLGLLAQTPKKEAPKPLTPEQQATLQAKKMRLHLDLNATQEEKIKASLTEHFTAVKQQRKVLREKQASRYDRQLAQLDAQLEMQEKMKDFTETLEKGFKKAETTIDKNSVRLQVNQKYRKLVQAFS